MTAEDRLRSQLRNTASSMPVGSGSLAGVEARAAQLQRRRSAMRGGAGAFALAAVALVGVVSLRDGGVQDFAGSVEADSMSDTDARPASTQAMTAESADFDDTEDMEDMADDGEVELAVEESIADGGAAQESITSQEMSDDSVLGDEAMSEEREEGMESDEEMSDDMAESEQAPSPSSDLQGAVFAATVAAVAPPAEAEGVAMSYSFSGGHAVAQSADDWYSYDGVEWQSLGLPPDIEVVAVDLTALERIAILGHVRLHECAVEHVVGVRTDGDWSFARIDDGTPPIVGSDLLAASVRVTDRAVEVERTERLWLHDECADRSDYAEPTGDAAKFVQDLVELGEIQRQTSLVASFEPHFEAHWPDLSSDDARGAAVKDSSLQWEHLENPLLTVEAIDLTPASALADDGVSVALHKTTFMNVATTVHVSDGVAMLQRGEQSWEVCPIPDVDEAHGEIGRAGEHLAVVVGKPEQTLFLVERAE